MWIFFTRVLSRVASNDSVVDKDDFQCLRSLEPLEITPKLFDDNVWPHIHFSVFTDPEISITSNSI